MEGPIAALFGVICGYADLTVYHKTPLTTNTHKRLKTTSASRNNLYGRILSHL